jgi:hypothetical protein
MQRAQFALEDERLLTSLRKCGIDKSELVVIGSQKFSFSSPEEASDEERIVKEQFTKEETIAAKVLTVYKNDSNATTSSIAQMLGIDESALNDIIANLIKRKQLKKGKDGSLKVSSLGLDAINNSTLKTDIFIMYDYDLAPGVPGPLLLDTSREFCREIVKMNKMWTLTDIQNLSFEYGYDVWERRGGFWRHKGTDETTPYCRHIWSQKIVTKVIK